MKNTLLSEKELLVFGSLQRLGRSLVSETAQETLLNRTALYHTLSLLIDKGLINELKIERVSYYEPISLGEYAIWKRRKVEALNNDLLDIERAIASNTNEHQTLRSKFKYYEGFEALKNLYAETWRSNQKKEILAITDYQKAYETLNDFFENEYFPDRVKRKIKVLSLLPKDKFGVRDLKREKELLREMRFSDLFKDLGIEINIFDNSVALFAFDKKKPTGILIENMLIARTFEKMFRFIWEKSKNTH